MSSATSNRRLRVICWSGRSAWPLSYCSDITRRRPVISELITQSVLGVLNGNVSTTIISRKMTIISKKNDNEIKIC